MTMSLIKTTSLCKHYSYDNNNYETGISDVCLDIKKGEFLALRGQSGSGKSTLLNILGCIDSATSGSYNFCGFEVTGMNASELSKFRLNHIGLIFQSFHLMWDRSVLDNVALPLLYKGLTLKEAHKKASLFIESMHLTQQLYKPAKKLSGGQQQRVAIARALSNSPQLILADEPTGNLDEENTFIILDVLKQINKVYNATLLIATHDDIVNQYADRILTIRQGKIN
ncbi:TPA: ATP-binding cassette domain-containing protein [Legionella pneumophila]|nr:ABC transporter ATP-binding protein [Legionella pneumophila]HAT6380218.1 ABC transporter ATP-binding protein [Legionella pneumophila]HAT7779066.1 ATP-binding cassette domain-containing protein [Legionella pneumophila]HAT7782502.1 ATP-binding cassette domain-containing protein [Legionella pneumophila]HAT7810096.1 ATP-binding cassette domain-containing protein [Legionella pneumophila]